MKQSLKTGDSAGGKLRKTTGRIEAKWHQVPGACGLVFSCLSAPNTVKLQLLLPETETLQFPELWVSTSWQLGDKQHVRATRDTLISHPSFISLIFDSNVGSASTPPPASKHVKTNVLWSSP